MKVKGLLFDFDSDVLREPARANLRRAVADGVAG